MSRTALLAWLVCGALGAQHIDWNTQIVNRPNIPNPNPANQVFAAPNGSPGPMSPRQLWTADFTPASLWGTLALIPTFPSAPTIGDCVSIASNGLGDAGAPCGSIAVPVSGYNYSVTSGSGVTGNLSVAGSNAVTFGACPAGLLAATYPAYYYILVSGGTGTEESAPVTGGTCNGGGAGTAIFTTVNTHTGAWVLSSPSDGMTEAEFGTPPGTALILDRPSYTVQGPIYLADAHSLKGLGIAPTGSGSLASLSGPSLIVVGAYYPTAHGLFNDPQTTNGTTVAGLTVLYTQPDSTNISLYTQYGPTFGVAGNASLNLQDIAVINAWTFLQQCNAVAGQNIRVRNVRANYYQYGFDVCNSSGVLLIDGFESWNFGSTGNQIIAMSSNAVGMHLADSFVQASNVFLWGILGIEGYTDPYGGPNGMVAKFSNLHAEPGQWISGAGDYLDISNFDFYSTTGGWAGANPGPYVTWTGGALSLSHGEFNESNPGATAISLAGATNSNGYSVTIRDSIFADGGSSTFDQSTISAGGNVLYPWNLIVSGNVLQRPTNVTYVNPVIAVTSAAVQGSVADNWMTPVGTGSGTFFAYPVGSPLILAGNQTNGWLNGRFVTWYLISSLLNGWANFGGGYAPAEYSMDGSGMVHVRGAVSPGTLTYGTTLATLPAGFRPAYAQRFACANTASGGASYITQMDVLASGNINLASPANAGQPLWLDCIGFPVY